MFAPEGPINSGDNVLVGYWNSKDLYVLTDAGSKDQPYVFQNPIVISTNVGVNTDIINATIKFQVTGTTSAVTFTELSPGKGSMGYVTGASPPVATRSSSGTVALQGIQSIYQNWGDPTIFLAGAIYSLKTPTTGHAPADTALSFAVRNTDGTNSVIALSPIIIPIVYYHPCNGTTCKQSTNIPNAILTAYCNLKGIAGVGVCQAVDTLGWTTIDDAGAGHPYNYCPLTPIGCQPTCKAPCESELQSCVWNTKQFECQYTFNNLFTGEWWKRPWFIATMIVLAVILVIFIFVMFHAFSGSRDSVTVD